MLSSQNMLGNVPAFSLFWKSLCNIGIIFFLKLLEEFNSEAIWGWCFLHGKFFNNELNLLYKFIHILCFLFRCSQYVISSNLSILSCEICWHEVIHNIFFIILSHSVGSAVIFPDILDIGDLLSLSFGLICVARNL